MVFRMSSASLASSGSDALPTQAYTMPWLSSLSKGTCGVQGGLGHDQHPICPLVLWSWLTPTPHLEDEAELRVEEAGVRVDLDAPG